MKIMKLRTVFNLTMAALMIIISILIGLVGGHNSELSTAAIELDTFQQDQRESFGDLLKRNQYLYIISAENSWNNKIANNPNLDFENTLNSFVSGELELMSELIYRNLIVTVIYNNEIIYTGSNFTHYEEKINQFKFLDHSFTINESKILPGTAASGPFGSRDRVYYNGITLKHNNQEAYLYIAFSEKIMIEGFVDTTKENAISTIQASSSSIAIASKLSLVAFLIIGLIGLWVLNNAMQITEEIKCPYYQNPLCAKWNDLEGSEVKQNARWIEL